MAKRQHQVHAWTYFYVGPFSSGPHGEAVVTEVPPTLRELVADLYLQRLWVRAKHRHNGVGEKLLREVCLWADGQGASLVLRVTPMSKCGPSHKDLQRFYRRFGFRSCRDHPNVMRREVCLSWGSL